MSEWKLNTPVAFVIFNRPETTERVFAEIAKARPPKLLVVADGPRPAKQGEAERVLQTRAIIERVDWPCEVLTDYSDVNMGCKARVSSGLDWVFEHVQEAIILEDDCLPHPSFFRFCEELLVRYRDDQRIGMISGDNFQFGHRLNDDSYYFSNNNHIWGWATWRSRWQNDYDVELKHWPKIRDEGRVREWVTTKPEEDYLSSTFEKIFRGKIDTWDYQWNFASRLNGRVSIIPNVNMISNIGFGAGATHTTGGSIQANMAVRAVEFPLRHPCAMFPSKYLDALYFNRLVARSISKRIISKLLNILQSQELNK